MNTDNINIPEEDFNEGLEDIERRMRSKGEALIANNQSITFYY